MTFDRRPLPRGGVAVGWMSRLQPTRPFPVDTSALSDDGMRIYHQLGPGAIAWSIENAEESVAAVFDLMPDLAKDAALSSIFVRGMRASVLREMRMVDGEDLDPMTDECADVARDFARRGFDLSPLLETIRIGSRVASSGYIRAAKQLIESPEERANEIARVSDILFLSLERFSAQMSEIYRLERERWLASRSAERLGLIKSVLSGRAIDHKHVRDALGYELNASHIAIVAWTDDPNDYDSEKLEGIIANELAAYDVTRTLIVAVGVGAAWGWGAVKDISVVPARSSPPPGISIVAGQTHFGEAGFRRAHREAIDVEHLLRRAVPTMPRSVRHADVELATLLAADLENAQYFVRRQLGPLSIDDERMEHLRATLWMYLENERSVAAVAKLQFVSRNTVTYRVKKAEALMGRRIDDGRLNLQSALLLTGILGDRVLEKPPSSPESTSTGTFASVNPSYRATGDSTSPPRAR